MRWAFSSEPKFNHSRKTTPRRQPRFATRIIKLADGKPLSFDSFFFPFFFFFLFSFFLDFPARDSEWNSWRNAGQAGWRGSIRRGIGRNETGVLFNKDLRRRTHLFTGRCLENFNRTFSVRFSLKIFARRAAPSFYHPRLFICSALVYIFLFSPSRVLTRPRHLFTLFLARFRHSLREISAPSFRISNPYALWANIPSMCLFACSSFSVSFFFHLSVLIYFSLYFSFFQDVFLLWRTMRSLDRLFALFIYLSLLRQSCTSNRIFLRS